MEDSKLFTFLKRHWSKLLLSLLLVACMGAWTERWLRSSKNTAKQDFLIVSQIFDRFQQGEPLALESVDVTEKILKRHPELHPAYDAMLATTFLTQNQVAKAIPYAQATLDHVMNELPAFYLSYAETSLLLTKQQTAQAHAQAEELARQLETHQGYETLQALNLLRLVFLEEGDSQTLAIEKLQKAPGYSSLEPLFHEGELTLNDYLAH